MSSFHRRIAVQLVVVAMAMPARAQFWRTYGYSPMTLGSVFAGRDVARVPDGTYVMVESEGVFKADATGALLWSFEYDGIGAFHFEHVAVASDGTIGAVGELGSFRSPLTFVRVAPDGTPLTSRRFWFGPPTDLAATPDGGFVVATASELIKIDAAGDIAWAWTSDLHVASIVVLPDGRIATCGAGPNSAGRWGIDVTLVDATGTPSWRIVHAVDEATAGTTCKMALLSDGDLAVVAQANNAGVAYAIWMARVRPDAGVIWSKLLTCPYGALPEGAATLTDDSIVFAVAGGWVDPTTWDGDLGDGVIRVAPDGAILWQRVLAGISWIGDLVAGRPSAGVVVAGGFKDSTSPGVQGFLGQLDVDGWATSPCAAAYEVSGAVTSLPTCSEIVPFGGITPISPSQSDWSITSSPRGIEVTCATWACTALSCIGISLDPGSVPGAATLRLSHEGGAGAVQVAWDIDGDTVDDLIGNPAIANLSAGLHSVTARATDTCAAPAPRVATWTADVDVPLVAPTDPCAPKILRCGLLSARSFAGYRGLLTAGGHPVLDPTRDLLPDDLSGLTEVPVPMDATPVGDGNAGVIIFYEATSPSAALSVGRRGSDVVLSGW